MKRLLFILMAALLLVACGNGEQANENLNKDDHLEEFKGLLGKYEEEYDFFDDNEAADLFNIIKSTANLDIEKAKALKDETLKIVPEDKYEMYDKFYDDVIDLEERYSHIDWLEE